MTTQPVAYLTDIELDLVFFIERFHTSHGVAPTDAQINMRFTGLDAKFFETFKASPLVQKSFKARGIIYPTGEDKFTSEQMHAIAVMMDMIDRRSDEKKLRDLGITTRQWATWLQDDQFAEYLRDRSEKLLENSVHEAHKGLLKGVRNGNVASVKAFYEITGRYRPDEEQQIDIRRVLHTFIEILQKHIKDPSMLHSIAMDLSQVASAESFSNGLANQMMSNSQSFRERTIAGSATSSTITALPAAPEGMDD